MINEQLKEKSKEYDRIEQEYANLLKEFENIKDDAYKNQLKDIALLMEDLGNNVSKYTMSDLGSSIDKIKMALSMYLSRVMNLNKTQFLEIRYKAYPEEENSRTTAIFLGMGDLWTKNYERKGRLRGYYLGSLLRNKSFIDNLLDKIPEEEDKNDTKKICECLSNISNQSTYYSSDNDIPEDKQQTKEVVYFHNDYSKSIMNQVIKVQNIRLVNIKISHQMLMLYYEYDGGNLRSEDIKLHDFTKSKEDNLLDKTDAIMISYHDEIKSYLENQKIKVSEFFSKVKEDYDFTMSKLSAYITLLEI